MSVDLDRQRIDGIVTAIVDRLEGDWLLVGGALVALWLEPRRTTEDIDIVGLAGTQAERLALFGLATDLGLPIETLNSAVDFFVHRIPGWRDEIVLFRSGAKGRVWRPTPTLFLLLKIGRLSDRDLDDCLFAIDRAHLDGLALDARRVGEAIRTLRPTGDEATNARRQRLLSALETGG